MGGSAVAMAMAMAIYPGPFFMMEAQSNVA